LLYVNHSRAGALASLFSKLKHQIVEGRATDDLKDLLRQTRLNIDFVSNNSSPSFEPNLPQRPTEWSVLQITPATVLLIVIGILLYFTLRRKMPRFRKV
jgi:hypothetical protein